MSDGRRFKSYPADKPVPAIGFFGVGHFILHREERRIELVDTRTRAGLLRWGKWFEAEPGSRIIAQATIAGCMVSTIFLGLDHSFGRSHAVLFETMVFPDHDLSRDERGGGWSESYQERYETLREAEQGHRQIVELVQQHARDAEQTAARIIQRLKERP